MHNTPVTVVVSSIPTLKSGSSYSLTSINSQLLVTNVGGTATPVEQEAADGTSDQQWIFTYQSNGYYTISSASNGPLSYGARYTSTGKQHQRHTADTHKSDRSRTTVGT